MIAQGTITSGDNITVANNYKLNFGTGTVDGNINRINLWGGTHGFGINSNTLAYYVPNNEYHRFYCGGTQRFQVDNNGIQVYNVIKFTNTDANSNMHIKDNNNNPRITIYNNGTNEKTYYYADHHYFQTVTDQGSAIQLTCDGAINGASFNATSDYRVKENVQTISGENYTVDNLRPVSYVLKESQEPHIGFIAHELQEHVPTAVNGEKDGEVMQSVNYSELIPILVKEIQDLKQEVRSLKQQVHELSPK